LQLVLATRNKDKVGEIREVLKGLALEFFTLDQFPQVPEVIEDGETLAANALKKAKAVSDASNILALADDTGLEVDFLNGQPGVYSSRFAGEGATYDENVNKLLQLMKGVPWERRTARFRCVIAITGTNVEQLLEGVCEGIIAEEKRGTKGFGYDPVFYIPRFNQTFSEMPLSKKNEISHRGLALQKARKFLQELIDAEKA